MRMNSYSRMVVPGSSVAALPSKNECCRVTGCSDSCGYALLPNETCKWMEPCLGGLLLKSNKLGSLCNWFNCEVLFQQSTNCRIQVVFQKHRTALASRDSKSCIDKLWLQQVTSGGGLKRIQECLEEKCLARRGKSVTIETAVAELAKVKSGKLFEVLTKAAQGEVLAFDQWLTCLAKKQQPTVLSKPGTWLGKVWTLLPNFYTCKYTELVDGSEKELLARGAAAVKRSWDQMSETEDEALEMDVLDTLCCYLPWLDSTDAKAISEKRRELLQTRLAKGSAKAAPKQKGKQVKESSEKKAKDAAMAFLKKKKA
eukprot:6460686-Amphidinium_carterae.1